ncbi:MAG: metal-dependent transcriptional regulator, partial [Clostridia bacterium]|nr:metal-dependent transcriptional regulator [Clostridia bacterium]
EGSISVDTNGYITLTPEGEAKAKTIYERHTLLSRLLMNLGVSEKTATEDACRIEHYISEETFDAIKQHVKKYGSKE